MKETFKLAGSVTLYYCNLHLQLHWQVQDAHISKYGRKAPFANTKHPRVRAPNPKHRAQEPENPLPERIPAQNVR